MTTLKTTISHADTEITAIFARKVDGIFGGHVSVLPNVAVLNSARRQSRRHDVELSVAADSELGAWTVYRVGSAVLLIDAFDGATIDLMDIVMDDDEREEWIADRPELARLLREMYSDWAN